MPRVAPGELNPRQRKFVAEYVLKGSATGAALAAGYKATNAGSFGRNLLQNPRILGAIAEARAKLEIKTEITQERVLAELALLAFSDVTHYEVDDTGLNVRASATAPKHAMRAISSIKRKTFFNNKGAKTGTEIEIKLWDKPGPLKLAGRHVGLFPDKIELATVEDKPIAIILAGAMPIPHDVQAALGPETTTTMEGGST